MARALAIALISIWLAAAGAEGTQYAGRPLVDVLEEYREQGVMLVYGSDVVGKELIVRNEPLAADPQTRLREMLEAFGLTLDRRGDVLVVTPTPVEPGSSRPRPPAFKPGADKDPPLEHVVVHASRYELADRSPTARSILLESDIDQLVGAGREPLRTVARLPGAASSGLSSKQNIRGGDEDEVLLMFDGLPLFEPFHLKDFQSIFSILDPRVVGALEIYTGGFPVQYGDRLSGVINVLPQAPASEPHYEVGLDFFNIGFMGAGEYGEGNGTWLVSARRGALDLMLDVINQDIGEPAYIDLLGQVGWRLNDRLELSFSAMYADDGITLNETDFETRARADYQTLHTWLTVGHQVSDALSHKTVVAHIGADTRREGGVERPEESVGFVDDRRRYRAWHLKQDWRYALSDSFVAHWGFDLRYVNSRYRYVSELAFFEEDLIAMATGRQGRNIDVLVEPSGEQLGVYLSNRWRLHPNWTAEIGLRWDRQGYGDSAGNEQISPRASLMFSPTPDTRFRLGWGRFSQAQGVHELQVEDGVTSFYDAQRSYHTVLGLDHQFSGDLRLRFELYSKDMDRLWPRYENLYDQLELIPELSPDRIIVSPDSAHSRGAELLLRHDPAEEALGWWLGASWSRVEDTIDGSRTPRRWDQRRALNAGLNWRHDIWRADLVTHYHSGWPTTPISLVEQNDEPALALGERNLTRLPDFLSVDVRVSRRLPLAENRAFTVFFEATNLLGRKNVCCIDYSIEEDNGGTPFLLGERDYWLPRVPSLGFIYEF